MTVELKAVLLAALIPLTMVTFQGLLLMRKVGLMTLIGNRDNFPPLGGWHGRFLRAHANQVENLPVFGLVALVAHAAGVSNQVTQTAAILYLLMRLLHAAFYIAGITWLRSTVFYLGTLCVYAILLQLIRF